MSSELVLREQSLPEKLEAARELIASASIEDLKELHDRASATEVFARAKKDRETYLLAGEVKLWSERRVGEIRKEQPRHHGIQPRFDRDEARRLREQGLTQRETGRRLGVDGSAIGYAERNGWSDGVPGIRVKDFDEQFGVPPAVAYNWEKIADIPEDRFAALIEEAKAADGALTATGLLRREGRVYEKRVEPGIYRLRDGRLSLRWQKDGVARMKVLDHGDVARARKTLAVVRGKIKPPQVRVGATVGDSYALVRRALQVLDNLTLAEFDPEAKRAVNRAVAALHEAEDALVIASNNVGRSRRRRAENSQARPE